MTITLIQSDIKATKLELSCAPLITQSWDDHGSPDGNRLYVDLYKVESFNRPANHYHRISFYTSFLYTDHQYERCKLMVSRLNSYNQLRFIPTVSISKRTNCNIIKIFANVPCK